MAGRPVAVSRLAAWPLPLGRRGRGEAHIPELLLYEWYSIWLAL